MALSYVPYLADGVTDIFNIPFPYISKSHIQVRINGVLDNNVTFLTDATLKTSTMPPDGVIVEVRRVTPNTALLVDFADGSLLSEDDLDLFALQTLYVMQETQDFGEGKLSLDSAINQWDADGKRITNMADGIDSNDALTRNQVPQLSDIQQAAQDAIAAKDAAEIAAASINLPALTGKSKQFLRVKLDETGYDHLPLNTFATEITKSFFGNPNSNVAGDFVGQTCFDSESRIMYVCRTAGNAATAVWEAGVFIANNIPFPSLSSHAPKYLDSVSFSIKNLYTRSDNDVANIKINWDQTVNITWTGVNGRAQSAALPGTISVSAGSSTVTGVGTSFTTSFQVGDVISTDWQRRRITAITNNTSLTVESNFVSAQSGVAYFRGGEAPNTWYYVYAITNFVTPGYLLSTRDVAGAGDTLVDLPASYVQFRQLPFAIRSNSATNILPFIVENWPHRPFIRWDLGFNSVNLASAEVQVLNAGTATSFTDVDVSKIRPTISDDIVIWPFFGASGALLNVREKGVSHEGFQTGTPFSTARQGMDLCPVRIGTGGLIQYKVSTSNVSLYGYGFRVNKVV
jgi:hypothetical protein